MSRTYVTLTLAGVGLAWLVFFGAGPKRSDWDAALLLLGAAGLFYWSFRTGQQPPRLKSWHLFALWALPLYAAFQLIPLPQGMLQILSPNRALLNDSLGGVINHAVQAPISVRPAFAFFALFALIGYLMTFSLLRDIAWRCIEIKPWWPAVPLVAIACLQAAIALGQWFNVASNAALLGTFSSSEDLAAFLQLAVPFPLVYGFLSFRRYQASGGDAKSALFAGLSWVASLVLMIVMLRSASGVSRVTLTASLFVLVCLIVIPRLRTKQLRWYGAGIAGAVGFLALLFVAPPIDLVDSLAQLSPAEHAETVSNTWINSAIVLGDYRWFGTGPGGFESTYQRYQGSSNLSAIGTPGNDVLLILITYGVIGFGILAVATIGVLWPALNGALYLREERRRLLAAAITGSFVAILFRCCLESSLSVPGIAMASAWVAGLSQASGTD